MPTAQSVIQDAVMEILTQVGPATLGEVVELLPGHSWYEVLPILEDLSRDGRLIIRRRSTRISRYKVSLSARCTTDTQMHAGPSSRAISRGMRLPLQRDLSKQECRAMD
ncbi:MAG: hypothetical protein OEV01_08950 [Nitrospira sp.]|nr:hypothetical protein [Nitrospira sp.]MDH4304168.1 hypothetical protein [Nitrospira sp.]MDH5192493.1 hypothetical protein [Nitrospira sp.]